MKSILTTTKLESFEYSEASTRMRVQHFVNSNFDKDILLDVNSRRKVPVFTSMYRLDEILNMAVDFDTSAWSSLLHPLEEVSFMFANSSKVYE